MIVGFGIDAVDINRIQRWMGQDRLLARFFHPQELMETKSRGLKGITLKNILVTNNPNGKPELTLFDDAAIPFQRICGSHIHLSLTHESNMAIAGVILES